MSLPPSAEWMPHPIAERELATERQQLLRGRYLAWGLAVAALGLCPLSCLFVIPLFPVALVLSLVLTIAAVRRSSKNSHLGRERRIAIRESYAGVEGWAVELLVFQGAAPTGMDRGMLWFEDGRLYFVGERTSFGLVPLQVTGNLHEGWAMANLRAAATLRLRARTAAGGVALGINVLPEDYGATGPYRGQTALAKTVSTWVANEVEGDGQLPPLTLGPDAPTERELLIGAVLSVSFWVAIAFSLVAIGWAIAWWVIPPAAAFGGCVLVLNSDIWAPRLRWQAWRDRRRLGDDARQNKAQ